MPPTEFLADRRDAGRTIAAVLRARFGLPWSQAKRLIERGHVRVAGFAVADPGHRVKNRNRVWIKEGVITAGGPKPAAKPAEPPTTPAKPKSKPAPRGVELPAGLTPDSVVYSDAAVVVVDKPAGLTTMRHAEEAAEFGRGQRFLPKTLADALPHLLGSPNRKVIAVHRIDRDTSGLVVFARTPAAAKHLTEQFRKHTADRRYLALTRNRPDGGRRESVFVPDRGDGRRGSGPADAPDGKRAVTHVKVIEPLADFALVECRLETGRTHQVRIHLGEAGAPLCGERVYDRPVNGAPLPDGSEAARPMLHAARLGFAHPETGEQLRWEAQPPADFQATLHRLRQLARA